MKKIILTIAVFILVSIAVILVVMYNMGDRLIEEAIRSDLLSSETTGTDNQPDNTQPVESTQVQQNDSNNTPVEGDNESPPPETEASQEPAVEPSEASEDPGKSNEPAVNEPAVNEPAPAATQQPVEIKTELTTAEINEIKDEVSAADKISAAALVLKRLSPSDINELKSLLANGLSEDDRAKAKELAYSRFTEDEISRIKEMYEKYMK